MEDVVDSKEVPVIKKKASPLKTIRLHCLECSGGSPIEVKNCPCVACKLYPYRIGRSVNRMPRILTDEQREQIRNRLKSNIDKHDNAEMEE